MTAWAQLNLALHDSLIHTDKNQLTLSQPELFEAAWFSAPTGSRQTVGQK